MAALLLDVVRRAVADYIYSEGCVCCQGMGHDEHGRELARLLGVEDYEDGSGPNWDKYRSEK